MSSCELFQFFNPELWNPKEIWRETRIKGYSAAIIFLLSNVSPTSELWAVYPKKSLWSKYLLQHDKIVRYPPKTFLCLELVGETKRIKRGINSWCRFVSNFCWSVRFHCLKFSLLSFKHCQPAAEIAIFFHCYQINFIILFCEGKKIPHFFSQFSRPCSTRKEAIRISL